MSPSTMSARNGLLDRLSSHQSKAVQSKAARLLVVAGAGSGKTEVMARRIAWWVGVDGVSKDQIVAFTFTEKAAEEMKFRIRRWIGRITPEAEDPTIGGMFIGTMHAFCVSLLRDVRPDLYGMYDVLDESGRLALVQRSFLHVLGLSRLRKELGKGQFATIDDFLFGYDLLNEYGELEVDLPEASPPTSQRHEGDWCKQAVMRTEVGADGRSAAFGESAARYYALLHARRFLDFSTAQAECVRMLESDREFRSEVHDRFSHVVVDEVQDVNPVQDRLVRALVGDEGRLTAVGDHRQAIFGWRGGRVELMGRLFGELVDGADSEVVELPDNYRSTPRIVALANDWARTIDPVETMASPDMAHARETRLDADSTHTSIVEFGDPDAEAAGIAEAITRLVDGESGMGARHDAGDDYRGIGFGDIAILLRTTTSVRDYMRALEAAGIPVVVRAGPDLFSRPEVLLMLAALGKAAGLKTFYGGWRGIPAIAERELDCDPDPEAMIRSSVEVLRDLGLPMASDVADRLIRAGELVAAKIGEEEVDARAVSTLRTEPLKAWLRRRTSSRRVFPQTIYQWFAAEAGAAEWDAAAGRGSTVMYHLGQLSTLVTGMETPGWVSLTDFKYQVIALSQWGAGNARTEEAPLLVPPDAVTISTIHGAKGLDWPVVFVADVRSRRFPGQKARTVPDVPFEGPVVQRANPAHLADNDNLDDERRLLYVALTRAQRYLFVSTCKPSRFFRELVELAPRSEVSVVDGHGFEPNVALEPTSVEVSGANLVTSFSDLRYYLECPHDYYLRKVLGFAPSIDQAFGYGRAVHNLMHEVHRAPSRWAGLSDPEVRDEVQRLIDRGVFYMRYTTGEPLERMQRRGKQIVVDYVKTYRDELQGLSFEPEREFETLLEADGGGVLVSGAIDLIRRDDPPTVTLIDFKSGEPDSDLVNKLDAEEMQLQIGLYGMAAKKELEYEPDLGLVRYLGESDPEDRELAVPLGPEALAEARETVLGVAGSIQARRWDEGPIRSPRKPGHSVRCEECDFLEVCGRPRAQAARHAG